ncbi:MAG: hypothetical protein MN733_03400 [Nitrososphaera sp.]|nr:hypothetical protein [Nitrososphaera sp.]
MTKILVALIKQQGTTPRIWSHDVLQDAINRAEALAQLHGVKYKSRRWGFEIDAREYYEGAKNV